MGIRYIDYDKCVRCGRCVTYCPQDVLRADEEKRPVITYLQDCQSCFLCEKSLGGDFGFCGQGTASHPAVENLTGTGRGTGPATLFPGFRECGSRAAAGRPRP